MVSSDKGTWETNEHPTAASCFKHQPQLARNHDSYTVTHGLGLLHVVCGEDGSPLAVLESSTYSSPTHCDKNTKWDGGIFHQQSPEESVSQTVLKQSKKVFQQSLRLKSVSDKNKHQLNKMSEFTIFCKTNWFKVSPHALFRLGVHPWRRLIQ